MSMINRTVEFLKLRLQSNPDSYLFARLADSLLATGDVDQAIEICENGLKKHPYYVTAHFIMGKCYLQKKMYDQAEKEFKRVLFFDPKFIAAHRYYAEIMLQIGWNNAAESSFQKILQIDPYDREIRHKLNQILAEKQQTHATDEANLSFLETADELITATPEAITNDIEANKGDELLEDRTTQPILALKPESVAPAAPEPAPDSIDAPTEPSTTAPPPVVAEEDLFEAVIEEEPPSPEEEERFSYILDDIFREEDAIEESLEKPTPNADNLDFLAKGDDLESERPIPIHPTPATPRSAPADFRPEPTSESVPPVFMPPNHTPAPPSHQAEGEASDFAFLSELEEITRATPASPAASPDVEIESLAKLARDLTTPRPNQKPHPEPPASEKVPQASSLAEDDETAETPSLLNEARRKKEKIVTPTLGEIYVAQGQYAKAIGVFEILRKKDPTNPIYIDKIHFLKRKLEESQHN